jgi:hypothetical protein
MLKELLAQQQDGFIRLTNDNKKLTTALHLGQHVKKELVKKLGYLQENLQAQRDGRAEEIRGSDSAGAVRPVPVPPAGCGGPTKACGHLPAAGLQEGGSEPNIS